ncbi:MAG TPA: LytTR family DNA-binding domain-containing protein [Puia sp.]|nr:LytTR family DNA-binding domain-containing protein [Puia sp.]
MKLNCIIVDDEYLAIRILEDYCLRVPSVTVLRSFKDPLLAMEFLRKNVVDLLFLDIQMPRLSGVDMAAAFADIDGKRPRVVFTTAAGDFAVKAFDLEALDYLVKPISFQRFEKAIRKAEETLSSPDLTTPQDFLLLKSDHRTLRVALDEIILIEGLNEYVKVHTPDKRIVTLAALKDLEARLPGSRFVRIHKSYIVSLSHIRWWNTSEVEITGGMRLPIGRVYKEQFLNRLPDR